MSMNTTNQERTAEYLQKFSREKTLKMLVDSDTPVVFDVGANLGNTITEFQSWWPGAEVHGFEPQAECWPELDALAASSARIHVNKFALGDSDNDNETFYTHDLTSGQSGFHRVNMDSRDSLNLDKLRREAQGSVQAYSETLNHERQVSIRRMDSYMSNAGIGRVDLLKIDTQGYEPEVLAGAGDRLADIRVVITELMFYDFYERSLSFSDLEKHLLPAGFRLYDISHISKNPLNGRTDWVDVIYFNIRFDKES